MGSGGKKEIHVRSEDGAFKEVGYQPNDRALPVANVDGLRAASLNGLSVNITDGEHNASVTPEGELRVAAVSQVLFEEHFNETPLNPNIWDTVSVDGGSVIIADSFAKLNTTAGTSDSVEIHAQDTFRHIFSRTYSFRSGLRFLDIASTDCTVEWGMHSHPSENDGWFFRLDQGVLKAVVRFQNVDTEVDIDAFNPGDDRVHRYDAIYRNYKVIFRIDFADVHTFDATTLPLFDEERLAPFFELHNTTATACSAWVEGLGLFDDSSTGVRIFGFDGDLFRNVAVTSTGRLLVSDVPPAGPDGSVPVEDTQQSDVSGTVDTFTVIGTGSALTIQRFEGGSEGNISGSKIEIFYDPDGDLGVNLALIAVIYTNGSSEQFSESFTTPAVGDGTARIVLRRSNLSGGATEIFGKWTGFEV